jgi:hypothetical protein
MSDTQQQHVADPGFVADCRSAVAQWRRAPALVVVSVAYELLLSFVGNLPFLYLAFVTLTIGWPGAQRAWYQRLFEGEVLQLAEVPRLLRAYFRRFFALGILVFAVMVVPLLFFAYFTAPGRSDRVVFLTGFVVIGLLVDFALTFVTPALAFTTARARGALRLGLGMLREAWPACALYVLVPPLAIQMVFQLLRVPGSPRLIQSALIAVLALVCKGATVRFYVRRRGATDTTWRSIDASTGPDS